MLPKCELGLTHRAVKKLSQCNKKVLELIPEVCNPCRMTINEIIFQIFLKTTMEKELVSVHELAKNSRLLVLDKGY